MSGLGSFFEKKIEKQKIILNEAGTEDNFLIKLNESSSVSF